MGKSHDDLASSVGRELLQNIRNEENDWKQVFTIDVHRVGDWDWPRPDYVIEDSTKNVTYANEFKPPKQNKREYLTGLGQAIAYLQKHNYSGLILPKKSDDGFEISQYICNILKSDEFINLPISLIEYDENLIETDPNAAVKILKSIEYERTSIPLSKSSSHVTKTFWCFWRDASHYEIFDLLKLSDKHNEESGDIYTEFIYDEFYDMLTTGKTKQWDGTPRRKTSSEASKKSEKQNYKIPLFHLGLWSQSEGRLTKQGYKLLTIGKLYGPDSKQFKDTLAYCLLTDGKHIQLINEIMLYQRSTTEISDTSSDYYVNLDKYLDSKGFIGKRKPTARTTGAKSYVRDEPKLWNHLGLLDKVNDKGYFFPGEGLRFNWTKITEILINANNYLD